MRPIFYSKPFKKDFKRVQKQGKNLAKLKQVISTLESENLLDETFNDHPLRGVYAGTRECHIEPDWLLIHRVAGNELHILRTGSHSELFKN
jgi:mRNA interferase YafQ